MTGSDVRVRFCPSPTGTPHVGLIRTALFNWAYARHVGGTFVFRIEDTDAARDSEESFRQLLDALRWLGLDWDEGVEVGGPHEPYRQSQRMDLYRDVVARLVAGGYAYESFSTPDEIEARHRAAGRDPKLGYDGYDRHLTDEQKDRFRREGRVPSLRLRMPDDDVTFTDLVRGDVTFKAGSVPDYVIVRGNGQPLYTLVNPVDDALMGITHVLRGEDLLSSTPRQVVLYRALLEIGVATVEPAFGHLPYVMGEGNKKLSKRDPESNLFLHRDRGFTPEGLLNYLALLGWGIGPDRDIFTVEEMVAAFDIVDVNPNPARFDLKKAEAINAAHVRLMPVTELRDRLVPYLHRAGVVAGDSYADLRPEHRALLDAATPLVQERMTLLGEAPGMLGFLFVADDAVVLEPEALAALRDEAPSVLDAALAALEPIDADAFTAEPVQEALKAAIVGGPGHQATVRVRAAAHRGVRSPGLAAAVRVDGDPRQGRVPRPDPGAARPPRRPDVVLAAGMTARSLPARPRGSTACCSTSTTRSSTPEGRSRRRSRSSGSATCRTCPPVGTPSCCRTGAPTREVTTPGTRAGRPATASSAWRGPTSCTRRSAGPCWTTTASRPGTRSSRTPSAPPGSRTPTPPVPCASCSGLGIAVGALSNASVDYQSLKLERVGLADLVPMLVGVDTLGFGKPDPRVFIEACRLLGTDPARTAYVGDELDVDAVAARAAGLVGVWLDRPGPRRVPVSEHDVSASGVVVIRGLGELADALALEPVGPPSGS